MQFCRKKNKKSKKEKFLKSLEVSHE